MTAAGFPDLLAQVAFTSQATDTTPTWVDLSGRVAGLQTTRGRQSELTVCNPGTAVAQLDNTDNELDADNPSGTWYGYIRPNRKVRYTATVGGTPYVLHTGYADAFPRSWPGGAGEQRVALSSTDRFKILARRKVTYTGAAEDADVRVDGLLDAAGVGSVDRIVNADTFAARALVAHKYVAEDALQSVQDAARSDGGQLFVDGSGSVVFQTVKFRQSGGNTRARTSQARFGNDATSIPVEDDLNPTVDDTLMANRVLVGDGTSAGTVHVAQDTTAQAEDELLELDLGSTLLAATDAADRAADVLALRKDPITRVESLTVNLLTLSTAEQQAVLGLEISDRVTVAVIPPGLSSGTERDQWVESITHNVNIAGQPSWTVTFGLSAADGSATVIP